MRALLLLIVPALLLVPLSAAGSLGVLVTHSDTSDDCSSDSWSHWWSYDGQDDSNGGYAYRADERCHSGYRYASASVHDDDGDIVRAYARSDAYEAENQSSYGSWSHHHNDTYRVSSWGEATAREQGWSRTVGVETAAGDVTFERGCTSSDDTHRNHSSWYDRYSDEHSNWTYSSSGSRWSAADSGSDECSDIVTAGGTSASRVDGCSTESRHDSQSYGSDSPSWYYSWASGTGTYSHECRSGVQATHGDEALFAGYADQCDESNQWVWEHYGGGSYSSYDRERNCFSGVLVEAPADVTLRVGQESESHDSCYDDGEEEYCYSWESRRAGGGFEGRHSPLGPDQPAVWLWLP